MRQAVLGIVADADDDAIAPWCRIRDQCLPHFPNLPDELSEVGLIQSNEHGVKLGMWIMPDNRLSGMLETFLAYLVPTASQSLWTYATEAVAEAKTLGAPYRDVHIDKAKIYTWLAWQAPPGRQLHNAIMERILDPQSPYASGCVDWFRVLYDL